MTDEHDDETDDETDDEFDLEEIRERAKSGSSMGSLFGPLFSVGSDTAFESEPSEEVELAARMMMAGNTLHDFVSYIDEHDIDVAEMDMQTLEQMDYGERIIVFGFMSMGDGLTDLQEQMYGDDDDDNPFKVSDGDDPVY